MHRRILAVLGTIVLATACGDSGSPVGPEPPDPPKPPDPPQSNIASCTGCHTDYAALKQLAAPDTSAPPPSCGGDAPHFEPYDRVFMGGAGYQQFKSSSHGAMACTTCHGGTDGTANKQAAHSGTFVAQPSRRSPQVCAQCHGSIVAGFMNSIHYQGWGQKNSQMRRAGVTSFDQLHEGVKVGYNQNCATCHASCGDCHVNRPIAGGGGLIRGHQFVRTPDMRDQCTSCHSSRGGHAFFGVGAGTQPDVHLSRGMTCLGCHSKKEMHGDGVVYPHRYAVKDLPTCLGCHPNAVVSNEFHVEHAQDLACHTCHSQNYNNCGSCHVGTGARLPAHLSFKIARNPLSERPFRFALVRRTPAAPDSWARFGLASLDAFDAKETFNYTTPHNIQRWTARTAVQPGQACYANCHIVRSGDTLKNRELYLFESDLTQPWERAASRRITVDGQLPASWDVR